MFGGTFYVMKVSSKLFELGWTRETLPSPMDPQFRATILDLKKYGYSPERAAELLSGALGGNEEARKTATRAGPSARAFFVDDESPAPLDVLMIAGALIGRLSSAVAELEKMISAYAPGEVAKSEFYAGYLYGFPSFYDARDKALGDAIRREMFEINYGSPVALSEAERLIAFSSDQFAAGRAAGNEDGDILSDLDWSRKLTLYWHLDQLEDAVVIGEIDGQQQFTGISAER